MILRHKPIEEWAITEYCSSDYLILLDISEYCNSDYLILHIISEYRSSDYSSDYLTLHDIHNNGLTNVLQISKITRL